MLKKIAFFFFFVFTLSACEGENSTTQKKNPNIPEGKVYNIGIVQYIESAGFAKMRNAFIKQMREEGYSEDIMIFHAESANADDVKLNEICRNMIDKKYDFIVSITTVPTQVLVNLKSEIPVFYISVTNPLSANILTDLQKPDKNATGTSNPIPISPLVSLIRNITPDVKTFGIPFSSEESSRETVENLTGFLNASKLNYIEAHITTKEEVREKIEYLSNNVDVLFIPNDMFVQSQFSVIFEIAQEKKLPIYSAVQSAIFTGALATIATDDTELGKVAADMAIEYLNGKKIKEIPARVVPANNIVVNQQTLNSLGIEFPDYITNVTFFKK